MRPPVTLGSWACVGRWLDQLTCRGLAAGGLNGGSELALGALRDLGEGVLLSGDGSDDGDGEGEEGLELHFGGWGIWCLMRLVLLLCGGLFENW